MKGVILIVSLWILALLVLLAIGIGYQTSLEVRVVGAHRDRLKALALAQSALHRAVVVLEQDDAPEVDSLVEPWATGKGADGKGLFKEIPLGDGDWSVRYEHPNPLDPEGSPEPVYAIRDEERKIQINTATEAQWADIADKTGMPSEMIQSIRAWRGDRINGEPIPWQEGWFVTGMPKDRPFERLEELFLLSGMTPELFEKLEALLTVYGEGKVNLNTAPRPVLEVCVQPPSAELASLLDKIYAFRNGPDGNEGSEDDGVFDKADASAIQGKLNEFHSGSPLTSEEINALNQLVQAGIGVTSKTYRIQSVGRVASGRVQRRLQAVVEVLTVEGAGRRLKGYLSYQEGL